MMIRMLGAGLTLLSGALYAIRFTKEHRLKEAYFEELLMILEHFLWELQTNLSPLNICCQVASCSGKGKMSQIMAQLAHYLVQGSGQSPETCMDLVLEGQDIPLVLRHRLHQLADTLGRYDLSGQIGGIRAVQELCRRDLHALTVQRAKNVKSCQALGLCTGAAVAILLL